MEPNESKEEVTYSKLPQPQTDFRAALQFVALLSLGMVLLYLGIQASPHHGHGTWNYWVQQPLVLVSLALSFLAVWFPYRRRRKPWVGALVVVLVANFFGEAFATVVHCAKFAAESIHCRSYSRHLHRAMVAYSSDFDERLPLKESWEDVSRPRIEAERLAEFNSHKLTPVAFNEVLSGVQFQSIESGRDVPLLFDTNLSGPNAFGGEKDYFNPHSSGHTDFGHIISTGGRELIPDPANPQKLIWKPRISQ